MRARRPRLWAREKDDRSALSPNRLQGRSTRAWRVRKCAGCGRIEVPWLTASDSRSPIRHRIRDRGETRLLEKSHRTRHMVGRGDDNKALRRLRMNQLRGKLGVFFGIAGA